MKNTVQLCLDATRVEALDADYVREFWIAALLNNGCWPAAIQWALRAAHEANRVPYGGLVSTYLKIWWLPWFLSFPTLERDRIEEAVARLNRESNTEALPLAGADACARSAHARP